MARVSAGSSIWGYLLLLTCASLLLPAVLAQSARPPPNRIFFSKSFPGSVPAYFEVVVESSGRVLYREGSGEQDPVEFSIHASEAGKIFELARKLDYFRSPVASPRKVAFTGEKTLRYEDSAGDAVETQFVYSEKAEVRELLDWFEKVAETERHRMELERTVQFDRLGVNKALLLFQISFDRNQIVAPEQFLPVLHRIANQKQIVHIARARAASLVERIDAAADR